MRLVDQFVARHPGVSVEMQADLPSEQIVRRIRRFELDAGVVYPHDARTGDLSETLLYQEEQRVVLRDADASLQSYPAADLASLRLGLLAPGMHGRQVLDSALAQRGLSVEAKVTADSIDALLALVQSGEWVGVVPMPSDTPALLPGGITSLRLVDPAVVSPVVLAVLASEPVPVLARSILNLVRDGV